MSSLQPGWGLPPGTERAGTLTLNYQPPEPLEMHFCCVQISSLYYFVTAACTKTPCRGSEHSPSNSNVFGIKLFLLQIHFTKVQGSWKGTWSQV